MDTEIEEIMFISQQRLLDKWALEAIQIWESEQIDGHFPTFIGEYLQWMSWRNGAMN